MIASDIREGKGDHITSLSGDRGGPVVNILNKQGSVGSNKLGQRDTFVVDIIRERILVDKPDLHSSGIHRCIPKRPENFLLKRPPVPQASSSQEALRDMISDSVIRRKNRMNVPTSEGAKHDIEVAEGNLASGASVNKELQFRRTASYSDADVSETTFSDMLKSNTTKPNLQESHSIASSEASDGQQGAKNNKNKRKKGKQIDPALLGFKVTSNQIMMGEIQRADD
ncbi:hypothetical protein LIER_41536 [Lithospermum erythrorhizon]|uniref:Uncharacterized protein n=1 Tax=Lithospermum erythrorhizon TaxID=34254 RepID=A0AAV3REY1_LITER